MHIDSWTAKINEFIITISPQNVVLTLIYCSHQHLVIKIITIPSYWVQIIELGQCRWVSMKCDSMVGI